MRFISNVESVRRGEPTVLAITETLVAMGLTLWIAVHFGTVKHIVVSACIAPFLLLRTDESAVFGVRIFDKIGRWLRERPRWLVWIVFIPLLLSFAPIRVFATVVTVLRSPAAVIRAIPWNWRRIAVATDFCRSPQFLPTPDDATLLGGMDMGDGYDLYRGYREKLDRAGEGATWAIAAVIWWLMLSVVLLLAGLPAILYRWSLKSTAIIWFPLLWALREVAPSDKPLRARLSLFEKSDLVRFVLLVSAAALLAFALKLWFWNEAAHAAAAWNETLGGRIATIHIAPGVIEWWQVATVLNSAIAIVLWLYVRSCLRHIKVGVPRREVAVERVLGWTLFVRRLLTTYTILCVGYLYFREATAWQLPPLGGKLFPWM